VADLTLSLSDGVGAALTAPSSVETPGVLIEVQGNAESRAARKQITLLEGDTLPDLVFLLLDAFSTLERVDVAVTCAMAGSLQLLVGFQYPRTGRCRCNWAEERSKWGE